MTGRNSQGLRALAVALLLAVGCMAATAATAAGKITVTGQGMVPAAPDMATILLGVTTQAKTAQAAMADN